MITASVVAFRNSVEELEELIQTIDKGEISKLFIVDNSPSDDLKKIQTLSSKIQYIFLNENVGFGAGHNKAIKAAIESNSKYHIILNPDIEFNPNIVSDMQVFLNDNSDVGLIMPKIIYPNGETQYLAKMLPTPLDWIGRRFIPFKEWVAKRNHVYELRDSGYNKIMNIPYLSGCFMFIRTSVLEEIGLFDEGIFMYGEDTDLTRRIYAKYKTLFYPEVTVTHVHNKESYRNYKLLLIHIKAAIYYFNKWGWFFDSERRKINKKLKEDYLQSK